MRCFLKCQPYQKTENWLGGKKTPMNHLFFVIYRVLKTVLLKESHGTSVSTLELIVCAVPFQYWELCLQSAIKCVETLRRKKEEI